MFVKGFKNAKFSQMIVEDDIIFKVMSIEDGDDL